MIFVLPSKVQCNLMTKVNLFCFSKLVMATLYREYSDVQLPHTLIASHVHKVQWFLKLTNQTNCHVNKTAQKTMNEHR